MDHTFVSCSTFWSTHLCICSLLAFILVDVINYSCRYNYNHCLFTLFFNVIIAVIFLLFKLLLLLLPFILIFFHIKFVFIQIAFIIILATIIIISLLKKLILVAFSYIFLGKLIFPLCYYWALL